MGTSAQEYDPMLPGGSTFDQGRLSFSVLAPPGDLSGIADYIEPGNVTPRDAKLKAFVQLQEELEELEKGPQSDKPKVVDVDSQSFQTGVGAVILMNMICEGFVAQYIGDEGNRLAQMIMDFEISFVVIYTVEVCLRIYEKRWKFFFDKKEYGWNIFDLTLTCGGLIDASVSMSTEGGKRHGTVAVRLFRALRILRIFRIFRFFRDLDYMLMTATKATFMVMFLVILLNYISAIVITLLMRDSQDAQVRGFFGKLSSSMWTLFEVMTLDDWTLVAKEVIDDTPSMWIFFAAFIFFASFALMTLVPGVFIEINSENRQIDKERKAMEEWYRERTRTLELLRKLYVLADEDGDGSLSKQELSEALRRPEVRKALKIPQDDLDIIQAELDQIFDSMALADESWEEEGNRGISEEEFVATFLAIKARPESKEVMIIQREMARQSTLLKSQMLEMQYMVKGIQEEVRSMRDELQRKNALEAWLDGAAPRRAVNHSK